MKNSIYHPKLLSRLQLCAVVAGLLILLTTSSCTNIKNLQYAQGQFDTARLSQIQFNDPLIQKGDLLGISVYSDDLIATSSVTLPSQSNTSGSSVTPGGNTPASAAGNAATSGFLVDQQGNIQLYKLGVVRAEGKTKRQLADTLSRMYEALELLKNPFTEVRFLNYKITLLGEVTRPGTYSIPADKVNAFEALGLAGDITIYGRRDNVLVVREKEGKREFARLDLSKPDVFASPYFYLQQNDMVIVDVHKNKSFINNQANFRTVTVLASILSITAIIVNFFRR